MVKLCYYGSEREYRYGNNHHTAATGTVVTMETASMEASFRHAWSEKLAAVSK